MNVKPDEERKTMRMKLKLNSKEYDKLKRYTQASGLHSMSQYMLNSIIATPIIEITDEELAPEKARLKEISDSINAIAVRVNQTGKIYPEDLQEIRQGLAKIQNKLAEYQEKLESLAVTPQTFRAIVDKARQEAEIVP